MLKKKLKSLLCAVLSAVTIISAVPVTASAATDYTPRKKHTQEEIAEVCNYISSVTDRYAMMPNGWFPAQYGPGRTITSVVNNSFDINALKMTKYLLATPNITSEQKKSIEKCMRVWRKSYYSSKMMATYYTRWVNQMSYQYTSDSDALKRAKWAYAEVNKSLDKYAHYNTKLADVIRKWNKTRYEAWKAAAKVYRSMSLAEKKEGAKGCYWNGKEWVKDIGFYPGEYPKIWAEFEKRKMDPDMFAITSVDAKMIRAASDYSWDDCRLDPFLHIKNKLSPHELWHKHITSNVKTW